MKKLYQMNELKISKTLQILSLFKFKRHNILKLYAQIILDWVNLFILKRKNLTVTVTIILGCLFMEI